MPERGMRAETKRDKQVNVSSKQSLLTAVTFHSSHMTGGTASGRQTGGICLSGGNHNPMEIISAPSEILIFLMSPMCLYAQCLQT